MKTESKLRWHINRRHTCSWAAETAVVADQELLGAAGDSGHFYQCQAFPVNNKLKHVHPIMREFLLLIASLIKHKIVT